MRLDLYEQGGYAGGGISENGGNITGPLLLAGNPSQTLEAVPKQYVDAYFNSISAGNFTGGTLSPMRLPAMSGDLQTVEGGNTFTLANSGVIAGSYGKITVNAKGIVTGGGNLTDADIPFGVDWSKINSNTLPTTLNGYGILDGVSVNGGTLTGFLTLNQTPTANEHAATKQYVDSLVSGGGIAVGDILRKPYSTTPAGFFKCNGAEVDKTTYADLYAIIGDNFTQNSIAGSGQPWKQQYQINSTQTDKISVWQTETTYLYTGIYYSTAVVTKNRVYLLGGWNGSYTNGVFTAPINADGSLGAWAVGTALPGALAASQAVVTKNRVYLMGGTIGNAASNQVATVYTAVINSDGTLGAWVTDTNLPAALSFSTSVVTKNRVYLLGGRDQSSWVSTVYTAPINTDGTLGVWAAGTSLPSVLGFSQAIVTKNRVYLMGGTDGGTTYSTVYTAVINVDGTLGAWSVSTSLPTQISETQVVVTKTRVYILGGWSTIAGYTSNAYSAVINTDGTLGTWTVDGNLPVALSESQAIVVKNKIYLLGGRLSNGARTDVVYSTSINGGMNDYSSYYQDENLTNYMTPGSGKPWKQQYQINTTQSADISGWTAGTPLPVGIYGSQAVVTKNRVYLLGGWSGSVHLSTVYTAPINADGTLGTWTTGTALPGVLSLSQAIITKNRVYLLGGYTGVSISTVYTAPINADGTLGTWTTGTALPSIVHSSQAIVTKNRVYLCGGWNSAASAATSTVYTAPINADGTIGAWTLTTSLPGVLSASQAIITKNRVYLLGGSTSSSVISTVYTATINSNGDLSIWTTGVSLPSNVGYSQVIVMKNRVYLIGGTTSSAISTVYTAAINADGTLGVWSTSTALPSVLDNSQAIITKNHIYLLGGGNGSIISTVYTATILEGLNDYSPYYDGTIVPNDLVTNTNKFLLPDFSADEPFGSYSYIKY